MRCKQCEHDATVQFKSLGPLCDACFCKTIEKRVRKDMAAQGGLARGSRVGIVNDGSLCGIAAERFVRENLKVDVDLNVISTAREGYDMLVLPTTIDDVAESTLRPLLDGNAEKETTALRPLRTLTIAELQEYARIKGFSGAPPSRSHLGKALDTLETRYPGTKAGIAQWQRATKALRDKQTKA